MKLKSQKLKQERKKQKRKKKKKTKERKKFKVTAKEKRIHKSTIHTVLTIIKRKIF